MTETTRTWQKAGGGRAQDNNKEAHGKNKQTWESTWHDKHRKTHGGNKDAQRTRHWKETMADRKYHNKSTEGIQSKSTDKNKAQS